MGNYSQSKAVVLFIAFIIIKNNTISQSIGIGTSAPSANAVLDVSSNSKGLMLPRLNDTSVVTNPTAGLLIYNQRTKSPNYHNGISWRNLNISSFNEDDSVTCDFLLEEDILSYTQEGYRDTDARGIPTGALKVTCTFVKKHDQDNSDEFKNNFYRLSINTFNQIKFNFYKRNTSEPYYSIRYERGLIVRIKENYSENGELLETITITAPKITFGDVVYEVSWPIN